MGVTQNQQQPQAQPQGQPLVPGAAQDAVLAAATEEIGKKGGDRVKATRGPNFYEEIGRKGGQKVKKLIEEGKRAARAAVRKEAEGASASAPEIGSEGAAAKE